MKKIGLAVCYDTKNYGSQLQVLATLKKIEELGFETEIIRYKKKISPIFRFPYLIYIRRCHTVNKNSRIINFLSTKLIRFLTINIKVNNTGIINPILS